MAYSSVHKRRDYCLVLQLHHLIQTAAYFMVGDAGDPLQCPLEEELLPCTPVAPTFSYFMVSDIDTDSTLQCPLKEEVLPWTPVSPSSTGSSIFYGK